ncbi:kinase-like domain-containing protein [Mycena crocata]|nr:kinase-like domain-containing protein [Mycena crocata]
MAANDPSPAPGEVLSAEHRAKYPSLYAAKAAVDAGLLSSYEVFWRDQNYWLKDHGYLLRPRYHPDWVASWKSQYGSYYSFEDRIRPPAGRVLDATRALDGTQVMLKKKEPPSPNQRDDNEIQIIQKFSSEPLASDPKNHCMRLVEILRVSDVENTNIMVTPLLFDWKSPRFATIGEAVDFILQIFEGLQFMHSRNVWHGDCKNNNIMMDAAPIQITSVHPLRSSRTRDLSRKSRFRTRTQAPVRYYWIDFDLSGEHDPTNGPPLTPPGYGGTRPVPEFAFEDHLCDPFAVDVYCLGNIIRTHFTQGSESFPKIRGFHFMENLVTDMMQDDPTKRPRMDAVISRFSDITARLSHWKLRSRFVEEGESAFIGIFRSIFHWAHQLRLMAAGLPAVPSP